MSVTFFAFISWLVVDSGEQQAICGEKGKNQRWDKDLKADARLQGNYMISAKKKKQNNNSITSVCLCCIFLHHLSPSNER